MELRSIIVVAVNLILLGGLIAFSVQSSQEAASFASDPEMEEDLRKYKELFECLLRMSEQDVRVVRIADNFTWLEDNYGWPRPESELGFSRERWDEYRALFAQLSLAKGMLKSHGTDITYFIASSYGLVVGGQAKGYAYSHLPLSPLSDSLDKIPLEKKPGEPVYKRIEGNWYLYLW